jgi:hypothetical protein
MSKFYSICYERRGQIIRSAHSDNRGVTIDKIEVHRSVLTFSSFYSPSLHILGTIILLATASMRSITPAAARRALLAVSEPSTSRAAAAIPRRVGPILASKRVAGPQLVRPTAADRTYATTAPGPSSSGAALPAIPAEDTFDIVIIGGANAGLALACALRTSPARAMGGAYDTVSKPSIRETSRILLLESGSLDRVRSWTGEDKWENRVSSLTAENVAWLDSEYISLSRGPS